MNGVVAFSFLVVFSGLGRIAMGNDSYIYDRKYVEGETYSYQLTTKHATNGAWEYDAIGIADHKVLYKTGIPSDQVTWSSLRKKDSTGDHDLSTDARKVAPYEVSLSPAGKITIPPLTVPNMIGIITDGITFFVAMSPKAGSVNVKTTGDPEFVSETPTKGNWADGKQFIVGEDCISIHTTMTALEKGTASYQTAFISPDTQCLVFKKEWMTDALQPGSHNNFQQVLANQGKYDVMWGNEQFTVLSTIERATGKILSSTMHNTLNLKMRQGCDVNWENCSAEVPLTIYRQLSFTLRQGK